MRITHTLLVVALTVAASGATWLYAQQHRTSNMLSTEDYLEIQQLYHLYARDVDPGSQWDASWMYTDDGTFQSGGDPVVGKSALKEFYEGVRQRHGAGIRHFNGTVVILPTAEGASGSGYMLQVEQRQETGPIEVTLFGTYADKLVKTRDGWRFKERVFRADTWRGAAAGE